MATMIVIRPGKSAKSICRLCFTEQEQYQSIGPLKEWIGNLTSLTITDVQNAPFSLCLECKTTLEEFESFREMCLTNDRVFQDMFMQANEIKVEHGTVPIDPVAENGEITAHLENTMWGSKENKVDWEVGEFKSASTQVTLQATSQDTIETKEKSEVQPIKKDAATQVTRINKNSPLQCQSCGKFRRASKQELFLAHRQATLQAIPQMASQATPLATSEATPLATSEATPLATSEATPLAISQVTAPVTSQAPAPVTSEPTNNPALFICDQCGKRFVKRRKYKAHILMHKKIHICEYCGKGFPNAYLIKVHKRVHTGEKPFPCELCGKGFFSKYNLKQHTQTIHSDLREASCDLCKMKFISPGLLKCHLQSKICLNTNKPVANTAT